MTVYILYVCYKYFIVEYSNLKQCLTYKKLSKILVEQKNKA